MEIENLRIDKHVFEKALRRKLLDETVKVLEVTNHCMSEKAKNFLSDLYQVSVKYKVNSKKNTKSENYIDVIIKTEPTSELARSIVRQQDLFLFELKALCEVLPRIKEFVARQIGPNLFYGSENPRVLIMENLISRGFAMKDRQKGLPFEHCCLAIQQLARLHAGSVAVFEQDPKIIEFFKDGGIVSEKCVKTYIRLMEVSLLRIGNEIKTWSDEKCVRAGNKLIRLSETVGQGCIDAYSYDEDEFCVLNHGDCWINNMMFKENGTGQPIDLLLVDFQMTVYTSPAIDLIYFLNICPEFDVKYDNDEHFLKVYLNTLSETMESIGCNRKPPTMEELKKAMHKRRIYAVFSGIVLYLRMMADKEDTEDFVEVLSHLSGETKMNVFRNPDAVKLAHKMIPVMDERGYLD